MPTSPFRFELATPADDAAIRRLLAANPVPGHLTLGYEREPDYFLGCATMGPFWQVLVGRHEPTGELVGLACRAARPLWVNGQPQTVGYLSQLRVDARWRGRWLVAAGFHAMRRFHDDGRVAAYLATLIEDNREAHGILVARPRRHFPKFQPCEPLVTLALLLRRGVGLPARWQVGRLEGRARNAAPPVEAIERASVADLPALVAFLRDEGSRKQFFPVWTEADFRGSPTALGFCVEDFFVARRGGRIVGTIGLWDQSAFKQTVARGYGGALRWARPLVNVAARLGGARPLPAPGEPLRSAYASFLCVRDDDPATFHSLLQRVYHEAAQRGFAFLLVGLAARDPLLPIARRFPHIPYRSTLYTVAWEDGAGFHAGLDGRVPYVEIATL